LATILYETFQDELERGATYPQEFPMSRNAFDAYFLGNDCFVGILHPPEFVPPQDIKFSIENARNSRDWNECLAGAYYVSFFFVNDMKSRSERRSRYLFFPFQGETKLPRSIIPCKLEIPPLEIQDP